MIRNPSEHEKMRAAIESNKRLEEIFFAASDAMARLAEIWHDENGMALPLARLKDIEGVIKILQAYHDGAEKDTTLLTL